MTISKLIEELEKIEEEYGDLEVETYLAPSGCETAEAGPLKVYDSTGQYPKDSGNRPTRLIIH